MSIRRHYFACESCKNAGFPVDERIDMCGRLTARARKVVCLFNTGWGADNGAMHLADVCGWKISPQSVRRYCYAEAAGIDKWRAHEQTTNRFQAAPGEVEFQTDGTMINTVEDGWREIRIGVFLKRAAGAPARIHEWSTRKLPAPTARSVRVVMATAEEFGATWRAWASSLGILLAALITVLADGAKWIWAQAAEQLPGCRGVLDVFHMLEHLAAATRAVYGERTGAAQAWKDSGLRAVLGDGWGGLCRWVGRWRECCGEEHSAAVNEATEDLLGYLANHIDHLGYCERLAKGASIGSGQIEGACKYVIGRRLKRTGGRWRKANAVKMATVCSTHYAGDWTPYWESCFALAA